MKSYVFLGATILLTIGGNSGLHAQSKREPLTFEDIRQWRNHSVTLSDNGEWYTTLYTLYDKKEAKEDSVEHPSEQKLKGYYKEDNQTDILYICNAKDGVKYEVPNGSKPAFSTSSDWIAYQIKF